MFRLIAVFTFLVPGLLASSFSDVNRDCIAANTNQSSNDFLLGKWYRIYEFIPSALTPSVGCPEHTYTKPTAEELQEYHNKYNPAGFPFTLDENPILQNQTNNFFGMVSGNTEAKFYVLDPKSVTVLNWDGYEVNIYRRITDDYVLWWRCAMRGQMRWLLARERNPPQEEVLQIIASIPDVSRMFARRYCTRF